MEFKNFNNKIKEQFQQMCKTGKLFRVDVSGDTLWKLYLSSFKEEKTFRDPSSSEHNCNCCKNFIRRYGNIVAINDDGQLISMFNDIDDAGEYTMSARALALMIESSTIKDVFFESYDNLNRLLNYEKTNKTQDTYKLGIESNLKQYTLAEANAYPGTVDINKVYEFNHFQIDLPKQFVIFKNKSIESVTGEYRDKYSVFKRAMEEIPLDTLILVKDLINQGSLLDGTAHLHSINEMLTAHKELAKWHPEETIEIIKLNNWYWMYSYLTDERVAKFRNTLIGVLCTELAEGMELNKACENWNKRVDPINYNKAIAPITKRQIETTEKFVIENGYLESFNRRLATIDDIIASEILHMNSGDNKIKEVSIFSNIKPTSKYHKQADFDKTEEISINKFMNDILPSCTSIEAYLENRMEGNLVTMTKCVSNDAKRITKWNDIATNYSWTFNGNLAGKSYIKDAVKSEGGKVDGVLRFSLMWAEGDVNGDRSDLDAHCIEPTGHICFSRMRVASGGNLDIDIRDPKSQRNWKNVAENITWPSLATMRNGIYEMIAHNYANRGNKYFEAEIEFLGKIYNYRLDRGLINKEKMKIAIVRLKDGEFSIEHCMPEINQSKELWGLNTNNFHKVNLVCKSPNHWGDNNVGNLHYMFMLEGCKCNTKVRSFHSENLIPELAKERKVLEVLGATNMIEPTDNQLSGLGFNSTVRDELIVRCKGSFNRQLKIKF